MRKHNAALYIVFLVLLFFGLFSTVESSEAANHYVRAGASGANNGTDWANAWTQLPATLTRGDTYYIADGTYPSYTFDDPTSGTQYITIKKATIADHGSDAGWQDSYGDGQAILGSTMTFVKGYYVIDGNGTHTIPSNNTNDYGFKISSDSSTNTTGIVRFGTSGNIVSNITIRYTHVYNTTNGSINNGTVMLRFYPSNAQSYIKVQNCFLENSGKDGIQISSSNHILVERCYIKRLGHRQTGTPDYHGQTVQMFWGVTDVIFRWNIWEGCEGQSLIAYGDDGTTTTRIRFYGNVVFIAEGIKGTAGFGASGGLIGNAWAAKEASNIFIYNNTIVNQRADQSTLNSTAVHFPVRASTTSNLFGYNNLFYNSEASSSQKFTAYGYNASGGYGTAGGTNEQTGLSASIFTNYTGNNFTLASPTMAGLRLTAQPWWQDDPDSFFGQLDYDTDMFGNIRGADGVWDRGAFEFVGPSGIGRRPSAPLNLR